MTNGQCCTIAGGSFSCRGVLSHCCTSGGVLAIASLASRSVRPMKLPTDGSSVRATTAKCPVGASGSRVTSSTANARRQTSTTPAVNTANSRDSAARTTPRRPASSLSTDSCGTNAG